MDTKKNFNDDIKFLCTYSTNLQRQILFERILTIAMLFLSTFVVLLSWLPRGGISRFVCTAMRIPAYMSIVAWLLYACLLYLEILKTKIRYIISPKPIEEDFLRKEIDRLRAEMGREKLFGAIVRCLVVFQMLAITVIFIFRSASQFDW